MRRRVAWGGASRLRVGQVGTFFDFAHNLLYAAGRHPHQGIGTRYGATVRTRSSCPQSESPTSPLPAATTGLEKQVQTTLSSYIEAIERAVDSQSEAVACIDSFLQGTGINKPLVHHLVKPS